MVKPVVGRDLLLVPDQLPGPLIRLLQCLQPKHCESNHQPGSGQKGRQKFVPQRDLQAGHSAHQKIRLRICLAGVPLLRHQQGFRYVARRVMPMKWGKQLLRPCFTVSLLGEAA
ncbi:hypothetical protein A9D60_22115 [Leisingera sp. JC1]|nr:hypothetical protein A9D60_22115 [Leisingera sp. JC1]